MTKVCRLIRTSAVALVLAMFLLVAPAIAAPIRNCGNLPNDGVTNVTTRDVSCSDGRAFAHKYTNQSCYHRPCYYSGYVTLPGWYTYVVRFTYLGHVRDDVRATRPGTDHVIHFQIGPYGVSDGAPRGSHGKCAGIPAGQPCY